MFDLLNYDDDATVAAAFLGITSYCRLLLIQQLALPVSLLQGDDSDDEEEEEVQTASLPFIK